MDQTMNEQEWFSAGLRFASFIGRKEVAFVELSIVAFLALNFEHARTRAIKTGRGMESDYENGDGQEVHHRLVGVETLDWLGSSIADGREIYAEKDSPDILDSLPDIDSLRPEESRPAQTGI